MLKTLLMTGAAGGVGTALRPLLRDLAETVVLSDTADISDVQPHERFKRCDLSDARGVDDLLEGVNGVIHLGGISVERPFDLIVQGNIVGMYNLYEAARRHNRPRIIFASSNHVVGYYRRDERLDNQVVPRPDSLYGVSKVFGEAIASLYFDKFGIETLSVRIGSCFAKPANPRMLATWLSYGDMLSLCGRAFAAPRIGHTVVYGASDNEEQWWDNANAAFLGWRPKDSSEQWRAEILASVGPEDPANPATHYQGGAFVCGEHPANL
ncbi:NAD-dependent epimerase/dehydratase family protein [Mycoplana rhizolycopersici]|uniref:NAD(P)-dependent oxidoreductase n=1 Tax=Mycoplana rhizolycopersici TaxID=2746702 RepID=A0ABX2QC84_9HYPH|nr:NAD(P)-dependent oxidoreductase [Rhizobium rhizolycopersici]NVP55260.1 NAD(P)-dependent oxidoreductase [Rhizobium rhizolycopersici]